MSFRADEEIFKIKEAYEDFSQLLNNWRPRILDFRLRGNPEGLSQIDRPAPTEKLGSFPSVAMATNP
jgi:hypothetical protein